MNTSSLAARLAGPALAIALAGAMLGAQALAAAATPQPRSAPAPAPQGGIPVLIYHEVVTDNRVEGETAISLAHFTEQMELLADGGFVTVGVGELVRYMKGEIELPANAVAIAFEDGWKSALNATPVLDKHRFKASFWIITGNGIGGDYLGWSDIEALARNPRYEIHSHTVSHPWDPRNNLVTWVSGPGKDDGRRDALHELSESKRVLEQRLGRPVPFLAWPSGWFDDTLVKLAQEAGYTALFTTEPGLNRRGDDVLRIRRTFVDGACDLLTFRRTVATGRHHTCQKHARTP